MDLARFTGGRFGKVYRWWVRQGSQVFQVVGWQGSQEVGQFLGRMWCVVWVSSRSEGPRFPLLLTFSSHSLYLGIEFEKIWSQSWVCFICFGFLTNLKNSFAICVEKGYSGFVGLWKDYLMCVLRRDLLGLWKGVFWVYEWEFVGFVKRGFSGLPIMREKCLDLEIDVAKKMLN